MKGKKETEDKREKGCDHQVRKRATKTDFTSKHGVFAVTFQNFILSSLLCYYKYFFALALTRKSNTPLRTIVWAV
jgi:hypothetical protein